MLKLGIKLVLMTPLVAAIAACGSSSSSGNKATNSGDNTAAKPAITVTVGKSESRDIGSTISASGSLIADETSDVASKAAGKIVRVSANIGDFVGSGAVIAQIDDRDAKYQVAMARSGVKQAKASVRQAEARLGLLNNGRFEASTVPEVRAANAGFEQANAELKQAEANERRYRELLESGDVATIAYEQFRTARDTARARANLAKQQLEASVNTAKQSNQAIATAQAAVDTANTQLDNAEKNLQDTSIRAPFAGFISSRPTAVGEFVSSSSIVATVLRSNPIKIQIQVAEAEIPYITIGSGVSLEVDAYKDRKFAGNVSAVNPVIDPTSRSAVVEAQVENGNNSLRAGMFAQAKINREGGSKAVFVPKTAVHNDQSTQAFRVFVIIDGIAKLKTVQIGIEENGFIQIVTGVEPDQIVATSNLEQLYEGAKVSS